MIFKFVKSAFFVLSGESISFKYMSDEGICDEGIYVMRVWYMYDEGMS